jgi:phosphopentomutase
MSGLYKLTCPDCNNAYIGQTGRPFAVRFREHFRDFTHSKNKSKFAQHLLDHNHSIGPMDTIMDTLHITTKGRMMNTMEKFHIYIETLKNNQINDKCTVRPNITFDTTAQHNPDRGQSTQA